MLRPSTAPLPALVALLAALCACSGDGNADNELDARDATDATDAADAATDGSGDARTDGDPDSATEPEQRDDGEPCERDEQCSSGECLGPDQGFPDGMCTVTGCTSRRDCYSVGAACLRGEFNGNLCVQLCATDAECRDGYRCRGANGGSYCFPDVAGRALAPTCDSELVAEDDISSPWFEHPARMDRHRIEFEVSDRATAFSVVAYDIRNRLFAERLEFPDGTTLELEDYAGYLFSPITFKTVSPFLFPAGPQYVDQLQAGTYAMDFGYSGRPIDEICYLVIEETAGLAADDEPLVVDVNFYFVGVPGLDASSADDDPDFQAMIGYFEGAYAQAGVRLGAVRYLDVLGDVADRFSVIRSQSEVFELVTLSRQPGAARDELLQVNVFFNRGFAGEMFGVLGVSAGIPGAMGLHGAEATGLVFSADALGDERGNRQVGQTLAHELGHFLGLFHTTEQRGGGRDHLEDTPECPGIGNDMRTCPDLTNLMFPVAGWPGTAVISPGQSLIIRANPLTRAAQDGP